MASQSAVLSVSSIQRQKCLRSSIFENQRRNYSWGGLILRDYSPAGISFLRVNDASAPRDWRVNDAPGVWALKSEKAALYVRNGQWVDSLPRVQFPRVNSISGPWVPRINGVFNFESGVNGIPGVRVSKTQKAALYVRTNQSVDILWVTGSQGVRASESREVACDLRLLIHSAVPPTIKSEQPRALEDIESRDQRSS